MTGVLQILEDVKVLIKTDKRLWLAAGFLCTVSLVYIATGSWREIHVEEVPEEWRRLRVPNTTFHERINKLNRDVEASQRERRELRSRLTRAVNSIQSTQNEIDWQVDRLINTLESTSEKVDSMVNQVGPQLVQQKALERKTQGAKKKKRKR